MWLTLSLFIISAYFISAVPFALLVSRVKGVDLRQVGSGNIGATNVYRALGIKYAIPVFLLDALKGGVPVYLSMHTFSNPWVHILIGFICIAGHSLSCFVSFKGGKGVATGLGVLCALSPSIFAFIAILAFLLIYKTRYVAPTSIFCSVLAPILFYIFSYPSAYVYGLAVIAAFIIIRHRSNISRLIKGEENRI
jgi:glycerol-3-phosphate acyltransferase PlsY